MSKSGNVTIISHFNFNNYASYLAAIFIQKLKENCYCHCIQQSAPDHSASVHKVQTDGGRPTKHHI